ncbi:MAG: methylated-DNA--[protein]-cysteine S-methyltransferase [Sphingobacteriaceae bacterium]|nr:methylated-DNA--[protein]-cysteine S-methyltransferase [Sphingobacteriaceae bacterium]
MESIFCSIVKSPIGEISILANANFITEISFTPKIKANENEISVLAAKELRKYFEGALQNFTFPIQQSGTDFQQKVWQSLLEIPYGETISYAQFSVHNPLAIRAMAAANGKNKVAIAIPCHRVIGSNGNLVGYAGEIWRKEWLINHEKEINPRGQTLLKF